MRAGPGPRLLLITTGVSAILSELASPRHRLCGIVESVARGSIPARPPGPLHRAARAATHLLGRRPPRLDAVAARLGVAYFRMDRGDDPRLEARVRELRPDLIVVCGMEQLLRRNVFSVPRLGAINVHPSLLPKYRGANPVFWTYYDMEPESGVTIHLIDDGADTGDVLFQESFAVRPGMPRGEMLREGMGKLGPKLVVRAIEALDRGDCPRVAQPRESPTVRARRVKPSEYRELIGWATWPIERVWHVLRGMPVVYGLDPPPGWRRSLGWQVGPYVRGACHDPPGSVGRDPEGHFVAHPEGKIRLSPRSGRGSVLPALLGALRERRTRGG